MNSQGINQNNIGQRPLSAPQNPDNLPESVSYGFENYNADSMSEKVNREYTVTYLSSIINKFLIKQLNGGDKASMEAPKKALEGMVYEIQHSRNTGGVSRKQLVIIWRRLVSLGFSEEEAEMITKGFTALAQHEASKLTFLQQMRVTVRGVVPRGSQLGLTSSLQNLLLNMGGNPKNRRTSIHSLFQ